MYFGMKKMFFSKLFTYSSFFCLVFLLMKDFSWLKIFSFYGLLDQVKMNLIFLTVIIVFFMIIESSTWWLMMKMKILGMFLMLCFLVKDMLLFYVFFELSLMPTAYIIFAWGIQPERLSAACYFLMYALIGSFPLLMKVLYFMKKKAAYMFSLKFYSNTNYLMKFLDKKYIKLFWTLSFIMKLPMYSLHLWLPKAHVEAPVFGSMILAAVLLKLGGYGLIRLSKFGLISKNFFLFWMMVSAVMVGLVTFRSKDIKSLMAYSSMVHMAFTLILFYYFNKMMWWGVMFMLVGHGFMSSGMFYSFKMLYKKTHSRNVMLKKKKKSSIFYFLFFFFLCLKASMPLKITFFSEMLVSISLKVMKKFFLIFFFFSIFMVGLYKMNLFLFVNQGKFFSSLKKNTSSKFSKLSVCCSFLHILFKFMMVYNFIIFF